MVTQEILLRKLEEISVLKEDGKYTSIDIELLKKCFKVPFADIVVLLYELEQWDLVKLKLQSDKIKGATQVVGHVTLLN